HPTQSSDVPGLQALRFHERMGVEEFDHGRDILTHRSHVIERSVGEKDFSWLNILDHLADGRSDVYVAARDLVGGIMVHTAELLGLVDDGNSHAANERGSANADHGRACNTFAHLYLIVSHGLPPPMLRSCNVDGPAADLQLPKIVDLP